MSSKIGVCMITGAFPPEMSGGGGAQALTLMRQLKNEYNFYVITTSKDDTLPKIDVLESILVYRVIIKKGIAKSLASLFSFIKAFLMIHNKIDIIHFHGFSMKSIVFIVLGKIFRKRMILKMSLLGEDDPVTIQKSSFGKVTLWFFSMADVFISISPALADKFKESRIAAKRLVSIPNGVNTDKFIPVESEERKISLRKELGVAQDRTIILSVGIFALHKRPDLLIDAWQKIKQGTGLPLSVIFVGTMDPNRFKNDPALIEDINRKIKSKGEKTEIIIVEKTLEIEKYYQASDIFVLTSQREGLSNALLEAMSCGLACVSTGIPGVKDYIIEEGKNGLLFGPEDAQDLADKLSVLLTNKGLAAQIGRNARASILDKFSINLVAREYDILYRELI